MPIEKCISFSANIAMVPELTKKEKEQSLRTHYTFKHKKGKHSREKRSAMNTATPQISNLEEQAGASGRKLRNRYVDNVDEDGCRPKRARYDVVRHAEAPQAAVDDITEKDIKNIVSKCMNRYGVEAATVSVTEDVGRVADFLKCAKKQEKARVVVRQIDPARENGDRRWYAHYVVIFVVNESLERQEEREQEEYLENNDAHEGHSHGAGGGGDDKDDDDKDDKKDNEGKDEDDEDEDEEDEDEEEEDDEEDEDDDDDDVDLEDDDYWRI